jgi:protein SCO1/2
MKTNRLKLIIIGLSLGIILLLAGASYVIQNAERAQQQIPILYPLPNFDLVDQNGNSFDPQELQGRLSVVDFIFTSCRGPCPVLSANMAVLYRRFKGNTKVQFVSISVDPQRDTLPALLAYAERLGVTDNRWRFLRGDLPAVKILIEEGFKLSADNLPQGHSTKFVLVDQNGYIRKYYDGTHEASLAALQNDLARLVNTLRPPS